MRTVRCAALVVAVSLVLSGPGPALAHDKGPRDYNKGQVYCPSRALVVGNVVVPSGRCYILAVVRDGRGTFLAFLHPRAKVPDHPVRLDSGEGRKIQAQIVYLVPVQAGLAVVTIPLNTIQLVRIQERHEHDDEDDDDDEQDADGKIKTEKVVLVITGVPVPNLTVTFVVRF